MSMRDLFGDTAINAGSLDGIRQTEPISHAPGCLSRINSMITTAMRRACCSAMPALSKALAMRGSDNRGNALRSGD
jgi:hypothetical protein